MRIGEIIPLESDIILNGGRRTAEVSVANTGDRPIQVGSHCHFFETNRLLSFDREAAFGMRLDIPSGASTRFEPGETRKVLLVEFAGRKRAYGLNGLTNGAGLSDAVETAIQKGFIKRGDKR